MRLLARDTVNCGFLVDFNNDSVIVKIIILIKMILILTWKTVEPLVGDCGGESWC